MANPQYPAIPEPNPGDIKSLAASVHALKQVVEILLGQRGSDTARAVTTGSLPAAVASLPGLGAGEDGEDGKRGPIGFAIDGEDGLIGPPGKRGVGKPGKIGPIGFAVDGDDGSLGPPGKRGVGKPGKIGPTGFAVDGDDGSLGPPGKRGFLGKPGKIGPPGLDGSSDEGLPFVPPMRHEVGSRGFFQVHLSGNQAIAAGSNQSIHFDTEDVDHDNWFDTTTYKFTPTIKGTWIVCCSCLVIATPAVGALAGFPSIVKIQKNGVQVAQGGLYHFVTDMDTDFALSNVVYPVALNGSTDYVDFSVFTSMNNAPVINGTATNTFAWGFKLFSG